MAEGGGTIIIKAPNEILDEMLENDEGIPVEVMEKLFSYAGVDQLEDETHDGIFIHEGIDKKGDYIYIFPFGDEWMIPMKDLVEQGSKISFYGSIYSEYGPTEYYALTDDGMRFYELVDLEDDENPEEDHQVCISKVKSLLPKEVFELFPEAFEEFSHEE